MGISGGILPKLLISTEIPLAGVGTFCGLQETSGGRQNSLGLGFPEADHESSAQFVWEAGEGGREERQGRQTLKAELRSHFCLQGWSGWNTAYQSFLWALISVDTGAFPETLQWSKSWSSTSLHMTKRSAPLISLAFPQLQRNPPFTRVSHLMFQTGIPAS